MFISHSQPLAFDVAPIYVFISQVIRPNLSDNEYSLISEMGTY